MSCGESGSVTPTRSTNSLTVVTVVGPLAVANLGDLRARRPHLRSGTHQPTTELASVTVVGPDLTVADAYATAVFVKGLDGLDWISGRPDYDAYAITHDAITTWTPGFERYRREHVKRDPDRPHCMMTRPGGA